MKELGLFGDVHEDLSIDQGGLRTTAWGRSWVLLHILSLCCHNYHYLSDFIDFVACAEGLVPQSMLGLPLSDKFTRLTPCKGMQQVRDGPLIH